MHMQKYVGYFRSKDRYEIYVLLSAGCVVDGYEPDCRGAIHFRFEDREKCEKLLTKLLSKKLKVYAHEMINAIRDAQAIFNKR